eukprot:6270506-Amphidinium_carterae.1
MQWTGVAMLRMQATDTWIGCAVEGDMCKTSQSIMQHIRSSMEISASLTTGNMSQRDFDTFGSHPLSPTPHVTPP